MPASLFLTLVFIIICLIPIIEIALSPKTQVDYILQVPLTKKYNEICFLTSHNAFASSAYGYFITSQTLSIPEQLQYGVRALMIDLWWHNNEIYMLHGGYGATMFQKTGQPEKFEWLLIGIKNWLAENPNEILTLILESYLGNTGGIEIRRLLEKHNITIYNPSRQKLVIGEWDTLADMIAIDQRLVMMSREYHDGVIYDDNVVIENTWDYKNNIRGDKFFKRTGSIYVFNHFTTDLLPSLYTSFNSENNIMDRMNNAYQNISMYPNFLAVNYIQYGDAIKVVNYLNYLDQQ